MPTDALSAFSAIERAERALLRRSGAYRKLWRLRSVELLAELFHDLCDHLDVEWLVECGAHAAEASERFVSAAAERRAIAIEANPLTFEAKTTRAAGPRLTVLCVGLARRSGTGMLQIPNSRPGDPMPPTASLLRPASPEQSLVEVPVETVSLNSVSERFGLSGRVALWIDVEGMAKEVLEGGDELIPDKVSLVIVETETTDLWNGGGSFSEVDRLLQLFGLAPLARDSQQDGQFNAIYVRSESAAVPEKLVRRYLAEVVRGVPLSHRLAHAMNTRRKQGFFRATHAALNDWAVRRLGAARAVRLKAALLRRGPAD